MNKTKDKGRQTKSYKNLIGLGVIILIAVVFWGSKNHFLEKTLLTLGYYTDKISIINTADLHGHLAYDSATGGYYSLDEVGTIMGFPLIKYFVTTFRKKDTQALLLDSGDMFHGTNEANIEEGAGVVAAANQMGFNAMTPGNHDFNFGFDRLLEIKNRLNFPILSANIYQDGKPAFEEYRIVDINGKKVGLFGLTVKDALFYTNSTDNRGVTLEDPISVAARIVPILKKQTDLIILISHLGSEVDEELVRKVDGIHLILCGHHHFLFKKPIRVKNTYLVEAGGYGTHVGLAEVYFRGNQVSNVLWNVYQTNDQSKEDKSMAELVEKYHRIAFESMKEVVGSSAVVLNGVRWQVRSKETNLGNFLADAMRTAGQAEIALVNGGVIRESIPKGNINLYQIGTSLPFYNSVVTIELKGSKLYEALERGVEQYPNGAYNGGFLHVSGIQYVFDGSKPAGKRLVEVTKDNLPLDKEKIYRVAINDYLYNGGDNYKEFKDARLVLRGGLLKDVVVDYLRSSGTVSPKEEGRIKVIGERYQ